MTPEKNAHIREYVRIFLIGCYGVVALLLFILRPLDFLLAVIIQFTISGMLKS